MPKFYVGFDVSKFNDTCSVIFEDGKVINQIFVIANNMEEFNTLLKTLYEVGDRDNMFVLMEARGHYHEHLFHFLPARHIKVQIKNPVVIGSADKKLNVSERDI